jgi:peptide/nickel transport system substrate-binding protein
MAKPTGRRAVLAAAAAIAAGGMPAVAAADAAPVLRRGGTLVALIGHEPRVLVPGVSGQEPTLIVGGKIHEGLLSFGRDLVPRPALARAWTASPDGLSYEFSLQPGIVWHDGAPFTAEDVVFSIMQFHMELNPRVRAAFRRIGSCVALDAHTVALRLSRPFEPLPLMLDATTCAIVPRHVYAGTDYRTNPANRHPVGTGPFRLESWTPGESIVLTRNPSYWKSGRPILERISWRILPDPAQRLAALRGGEAALADFGDCDPVDVARLRDDAQLEVDLGGRELFGPMCWVELNHRIRPLDDPRVRRALAMAIDRDFVARRIWGGLARPAGGPLAASTRLRDPAVRLPDHDPSGAARLLDAAGHPPREGGVRFQLPFVPLPHGEVWRRTGEYLQQALAEIGVRLVEEPVDAAGWVRRLASWDYGVTLNFANQWGDASLGVERFHVSGNIRNLAFANTSGFADARVDRLFEVARDAADVATRRRAIVEVQHALVEAMPALWLLEPVFPSIRDRRLRDPVADATGIHASFGEIGFAA